MISDDKRKVGETQDVLAAIGHENEKLGIKYTKQFMDQWDKKQWYRNQLQKEKLAKGRKFKKTDYFRLISGMLGEEAQDLELPHGYFIWSEFSGDGVILKMKDRWGNNHHRGFKPSGTPHADFSYVANILASALDTADYLEEIAQDKLKAQGFVLPS